MLSRAEEANQRLAHVSRLAVVGEPTASIAHEINQPLGAILSNADAADILLSREPVPLDELRQIVADIRSDDLRAGKVIRHMRALLRRRELAMLPFDLNRAIADDALSRLEVDSLGLDQLDRRYLAMIAHNFGGGPVGIETIAAGLSEPRDAIEDIIEPYLIQQGFIQRTPRGRMMTAIAWKHMGLAAPVDLPQQQINLFQEGD